MPMQTLVSNEQEFLQFLLQKVKDRESLSKSDLENMLNHNINLAEKYVACSVPFKLKLCSEAGRVGLTKQTIQAMINSFERPRGGSC